MHTKNWNFIWKWFAIKPNENVIPVLKQLSCKMEKREHGWNIQFIFETPINRPVSVQFKVNNKDINSRPFKF